MNETLAERQKEKKKSKSIKEQATKINLKNDKD